MILMKTKIIISFVFMVSLVRADAPLLIITHAFNRPDFIPLQAKCFKKFIQDDYRFVVFSDANNEAMAKNIEDTCMSCNVEHIRVPQEIHLRPYLSRQVGDNLNRPNIRHANCVQYSLDVLGFDHQGYVLVLDSDMFFMRPVSFNKYMEDCDILSMIGYVGPGLISYLCPAFMALAMHRLPEKRSLNFNCGMVKGHSVDSGGYSHYYLHKYVRELNVIRFRGVDSLLPRQLFLADQFAPAHLANVDAPRDVKIQKYKELGFNEKEISFFLKRPYSMITLLDNQVLHYQAGSNYNNKSAEDVKKKTQALVDFIDDITQN